MIPHRQWERVLKRAFTLQDIETNRTNRDRSVVRGTTHANSVRQPLMLVRAARFDALPHLQNLCPDLEARRPIPLGPRQVQVWCVSAFAALCAFAALRPALVRFVLLVR